VTRSDRCIRSLCVKHHGRWVGWRGHRGPRHSAHLADETDVKLYIGPLRNFRQQAMSAKTLCGVVGITPDCNSYCHPLVTSSTLVEGNLFVFFTPFTPRTRCHLSRCFNLCVFPGTSHRACNLPCLFLVPIPASCVIGANAPRL
jgi:hypothetical protein